MNTHLSPATKLGAARELIRSAGIRHEAELLAALNCILSACAFKDAFTEQLADLCCDIDGELNYPPEESSMGRI